MLKTPVVVLAFNRPELTRRSFAAIREQKPATLLLVADGPRPGHPTDAERCEEVRSILGNVDWPCDVRRRFLDRNLGIKWGITGGLDWAFEQVDRAIILEDDCVPHPDFFTFCTALLDRYAGDERVSTITGDNFQKGHVRGKASYYFSRFNHCWGWATWRRAWAKNDPRMLFWPEWKQSESWKRTLDAADEREYWTAIFDRTHAGEIETWDYPFTASLWRHGGLTATPNVNLVTNIGFGEGATNTLGRPSGYDGSASGLLPITHPERVERDVAADRYAFETHFRGPPRPLPLRLLRAAVRGARALLGAGRS